MNQVNQLLIISANIDIVSFEINSNFVFHFSVLILHVSWYFLVRPRIDRDGMLSVTIKAGRTYKWTVDVSGEPPPTLSWSWRDKIPLVTTERIKIENVDYQTVFTIVNAVRKDTGKYTLLAENDSGKDEASLELTVLGNIYLLTLPFIIIPIFPKFNLSTSIPQILYRSKQGMQHWSVVFWFDH